MTATSRNEFAPRARQTRPATDRTPQAESPLARIQVVLRLPDLGQEGEPDVELVAEPIAYETPSAPPAPLRIHTPPRSAPKVVEPAWQPAAQAASDVAERIDQRLTKALPELGMQAAKAALQGTRWARLSAVVGSWGGLLLRPEGRWIIAAAGMARAVIHIRSQRRKAAEKDAAAPSTAATAVATPDEQPKLLGLWQVLAQPNAMVAAVLALACVLLAVFIQGNRTGPREAAPTTAKDEHSGPAEWSSPLAEAVVEPNASVAPPFAQTQAPPAPAAASAPSPQESPAAPPVTTLAQQPPPAPQPPQTAIPQSDKPRPPSPHAARRLPPTATVNEPLSLPGAKPASSDGSKSEQRKMRVYPSRETDSYGMPITAPAHDAPLDEPLQPPSIEAPPGGFDALGPQVIYPARETGTRNDLLPRQDVAPIYVAERVARTGQVTQGARLRGVIQPQATP